MRTCIERTGNDPASWVRRKVRVLVEVWNDDRGHELSRLTSYIHLDGSPCAHSIEGSAESDPTPDGGPHHVVHSDGTVTP